MKPPYFLQLQELNCFFLPILWNLRLFLTRIAEIKDGTARAYPAQESTYVSLEYPPMDKQRPSRYQP